MSLNRLPLTPNQTKKYITNQERQMKYIELSKIRKYIRANTNALGETTYKGYASVPTGRFLWWTTWTYLTVGIEGYYTDAWLGSCLSPFDDQQECEEALAKAIARFVEKFYRDQTLKSEVHEI